MGEVASSRFSRSTSREASARRSLTVLVFTTDVPYPVSFPSENGVIVSLLNGFIGQTLMPFRPLALQDFRFGTRSMFLQPRLRPK